ncbi:Multiprotein-bridging factor 1b-like [Quillaja saponaria]|uniref:Multiprotein-bridging factor 1b-like n=1 Tax=Quillaja saponaria TaxID=32244 RepID=A0AAD7VN65_QUISA|nr:Multiprotein-bridging factor 1b-like [Quillaja saponaria]
MSWIGCISRKIFLCQCLEREEDSEPVVIPTPAAAAAKKTPQPAAAKKAPPPATSKKAPPPPASKKAPRPAAAKKAPPPAAAKKAPPPATAKKAPPPAAAIKKYHDRVPTELKDAIKQARIHKKLTQSQLAQDKCEAPGYTRL